MWVFNFFSLLGFTLFSTSVFAQDAAQKPSALSPLLGIVLMLAVFFFLIILPQSRKAKKHAQFLGSLQKGDSVVTQSGIYGKIYGIADKVITLEIAPQVRIRVDRNSIVAKDASEVSNAA